MATEVINATILTVPGAIKSNEAGGYTVSADQVWDVALGKRQSELNLQIGSGSAEGGTVWYSGPNGTIPVDTLRPGTGLQIVEGHLEIVSGATSTDTYVVTYAGDLTSTSPNSTHLTQLFQTLSSDSVVYPFDKVLVIKDAAAHIVPCGLTYAQAQSGAAVTAISYVVDDTLYKMTTTAVTKASIGSVLHQSASTSASAYSHICLGDGLSSAYLGNGLYEINSSIKKFNIEGFSYNGANIGFPLDDTSINVELCSALLGYLGDNGIDGHALEESSSLVLLHNSYNGIVVVSGFTVDAYGALTGISYNINGLSYTLDGDNGIQCTGGTIITNSNSEVRYNSLALGSDFNVSVVGGVSQINIPALHWQD